MNEPKQTQAQETPTIELFDELPLHDSLRKGVREMGYVQPTPIQARTIPEAVRGRDIIGSAQTGSGKTAAFLLPILERLMQHPRGRIYALVLTPTRELALQVEGFLKLLGRHTHLRGLAVYGGVGMEDQRRRLHGGAEIIVATPGRLLDHMRRGAVDFRSLEVLVLDEADRMLDMGFLPDVRTILHQLPKTRQTMLFSATMPPEIIRLSQEFLTHPHLVRMQERSATAAGITHSAYLVEASRKTDVLCELLGREGMDSVLVFARTKHRADRLARQLEMRKIKAAVIHGDKSQAHRVRALEGFRNGRHRVLVATDIAARGIDVEGISCVINYDNPNDGDTYIHRVGRTARAQRQGMAISLVSREEADDFDRIEQHLGIKITREDLLSAYPPSFPSSPPSARRYPPSQSRGRPVSHRPRQGYRF
jgi:ATP-dependent RNA helicase RhlE